MHELVTVNTDRINARFNYETYEPLLIIRLCAGIRPWTTIYTANLKSACLINVSDLRILALTLANDQIDARLLYFIISLLQSSTCFEQRRAHHHHRRHISVMELGHLLTRSGLTYPEVSSKVCHDSFCQSGSSVCLPWVIYYEAFCLHVVPSFSCIPVICPKLALFLKPLQFVYLFCNLSQVYPAVLLMYFIFAAVILLASLTLTIQVSLPFNKTEGPVYCVGLFLFS